MRLRSGLRTAALVVAAFAGGAVSSHLAHATTEAASPYALIDQLARVLALTENEYVDPTSRAKLVEGAIKGMVAELDPHSSYMTPAEFAVFQSDTEGHFGGIGVEVDFKNDVLTVVAPMDGSPADRAGIRPGDQVVAVDGRPVRGDRLDKVLTILRGPKGSRVRVTLRRPGAADPIQLELVREEIRVKSVDAKRLDRGVGYLRIKQFQSGTHDELLRAVAALREGGKPLAGLLLDLRNNPGGLVDEAEAVADELLDGGVIDSTRHRGKVVEEVKAHAGGALVSVPLVVLVNEYSASAAELVAGALQDDRRAKLVGATTFGKGLVQTIYDLPGGAGMRLTTMRYYTPSGRSIQAEGVRPDVIVEPPPAQGAADAPVVRERDLDGHLPNEEGQRVASRGGAPVVVAGVAPKAGEPPIVPGRDVPTDPSKGRDGTLSVAWDLLLKEMGAAR